MNAVLDYLRYRPVRWAGDVPPDVAAARDAAANERSYEKLFEFADAVRPYQPAVAASVYDWVQVDSSYGDVAKSDFRLADPRLFEIPYRYPFVSNWIDAPPGDEIPF